MKRFSLDEPEHFVDEYIPPKMKKDLQGEYVKFEDVQKLAEMLQRANSTVRTHAMQSLSKVSARLANEIDQTLKELGLE